MLPYVLDLTALGVRTSLIADAFGLDHPTLRRMVSEMGLLKQRRKKELELCAAAAAALHARRTAVASFMSREKL